MTIGPSRPPMHLLWIRVQLIVINPAPAGRMDPGRIDKILKDLVAIDFAFLSW